MTKDTLVFAKLYCAEQDITRKDEKQSPKQQTGLGMEKHVKAKQSKPRPEKSSVKVTPQINSHTGAVIEETMVAISTHQMGREAQVVFNETVKDKWALIKDNSHLCAIDRDYEDFEGPILALEQANLSHCRKEYAKGKFSTWEGLYGERFKLGDDVEDEEENTQRIDYGLRITLPLREKRDGHSVIMGWFKKGVYRVCERCFASQVTAYSHNGERMHLRKVTFDLFDQLGSKTLLRD
ncbi:hypothetical protein Tco_0489946 [Tanacetum coccineum]